MIDDRRWTAWPGCPQCRRPRQTVCPTCGAAGNQIPLAEYPAAALPQHSRPGVEGEGAPMGEGQVLLMCPRCDEAFAPRFYRFCPACGCDAEEGLHVDKRRTDGASDRVLPTAAGLLVLLSLLLLCYWFLWRGA